jgi:hypothetical protein
VLTGGASSALCNFSRLMGGKVRLLVVIAVAASIGLVIGCGGDDDDAPITPVEGATGATGEQGPLSMSEFIDQADDICLEANTALANLTVGEGGEEAIATQELSINEGLYDSLRSLGDPPAEGSDDYEDFLASLRDAIDALEEQELAANRGDSAGADAAAAEADSALAEARQAASDYGFEECGEEGEEIEVGGVESGGEPGDAGETAPAAPPATAPPAPTTTTPVAPPTTTTTPAAPPAPEAPPSGGAGTEPPSDDGGGSGGVSP